MNNNRNIKSISFDSDVIRDLKKKHEIKEDFDLGQNLENAWRLYLYTKGAIQEKDLKSYSEDLMKKSQNLIKAINSYTDIAKDKKRNLIREMAPGLYYPSIIDTETFRREVERERNIAKFVNESFGDLKKGASNPARVAYKSTLNLLVLIYAEATDDKSIAMSFRDNKENPYGMNPLFLFIRDCLKALDLGYASDGALGKAITRTPNHKELIKKS